MTVSAGIDLLRGRPTPAIGSTEAKLPVGGVVFDPYTWDSAQTLQIVGRADSIADGTQVYGQSVASPA